MVRRLKEQTETFPKPHREEDYWHLHLPFAQNFIDSKAAPVGVRRLCVQTLINQAHHLADIAPSTENDIRVVVAITLPDVWTSQIIIFFGPDYFSKFFDRNAEMYRWSVIKGESLVKNWNLHLPADFSERGYNEYIDYEDGIHSSQIWFIGHLKAA